MDQIDIAEELKKIRARGAEVSSTTVLKTETLRVVLMALKAGARLHEHHADGRLVLQVLEGEIEFETRMRNIDWERECWRAWKPWCPTPSAL